MSSDLIAQQANSSATAVPLEELKARAQTGDVDAQEKLGDAYRIHGDLPNAADWYRKAATQGAANSQYQLAHILLSWANGGVAAKPELRARYADEAIPMLAKAANQGLDIAQVELGQLYTEGKFVAQDPVEAYKWFSVAAEVVPLSFASNLAKTHRDCLILKMTLAQIAEGRNRAAGFSPNTGDDASLPEPAWLRKIRLQGISGPLGRQLAIVNGKTLEAGESAKITVDGRSVAVRCIRISGTIVRLSIEDMPGERELKL